MLQAALFGAYKRPREATWIAGVVLLLLTLAFGLTGYLLPWDNKAYWATMVTTQLGSLAPIVGPYLAKFFDTGQGAIGVITFARFYGLHVLLLPAITAVVVVFHVYLVRKHGVTPAASDTNSQKFYPAQVFKDTVAIFVVFVLLCVTAITIEAPLERLADPTDTGYIPRPLRWSPSPCGPGSPERPSSTIRARPRARPPTSTLALIGCSYRRSRWPASPITNRNAAIPATTSAPASPRSVRP